MTVQIRIIKGTKLCLNLQLMEGVESTTANQVESENKKRKKTKKQKHDNEQKSLLVTGKGTQLLTLEPVKRVKLKVKLGGETTSSHEINTISTPTTEDTEPLKQEPEAIVEETSKKSSLSHRRKKKEAFETQVDLDIQSPISDFNYDDLNLKEITFDDEKNKAKDSLDDAPTRKSSRKSKKNNKYVNSEEELEYRDGAAASEEAYPMESEFFMADDSNESKLTARQKGVEGVDNVELLSLPMGGT